jgi:Acyl-CoA dehydrogenase, C-terminal domain
MVSPTPPQGWRPGLPESGETVVGEYPALLDALHRQAGALVASANGYVLASPALLATASGPLTRFGVAVALHYPGAVAAGPAADRFADGLLDLHRHLLRGALGHALRHLGERTSGGTTLLNKQLVQGQLADVAQCLAEDEAMPVTRRQGDPQARWRTHERLAGAARDLLMLLGASGFLARTPATDLHLAAVTANVYLHPGIGEEGER